MCHLKATKKEKNPVSFSLTISTTLQRCTNYRIQLTHKDNVALPYLMSSYVQAAKFLFFFFFLSSLIFNLTSRLQKNAALQYT